MTHFNEDTRVKIPATIQFMRLGYQYQSLKDAEIELRAIDDASVSVKAGELGLKWANDGIIKEATDLGKAGNIVQRYDFVLTYKDGGSIKKAKGDSLSSSVDIDPYSDLIKIEITPSKVE